MEHIRAHIRLITNQDAMEFVEALNSDGSVYKYCLENFDGTYRVEARSLLGVLYFVTEHSNDIYLVNETNPTLIPHKIDKFRV